MIKCYTIRDSWRSLKIVILMIRTLSRLRLCHVHSSALYRSGVTGSEYYEAEIKLSKTAYERRKLKVNYSKPI